MPDGDNLFLLSPGQRVWQPVLSGSMGLEFLPGDEVCIEGLSEDQLGKWVNPGTVAVFYADGRFYFHRILARRGGLVYEKGDGNPRGGWIDAKRIIGLVVGHRRKEGGQDRDIPLAPFSGRKALICYCRQMIIHTGLFSCTAAVVRRVKRCIVTICR
ncbi:MAG: hypothetical protein JXB03_01405 [Spirochaetales bacterium]|nr:hypothetical protein [Spirochaetales bacterium]